MTDRADVTDETDVTDDADETTGTRRAFNARRITLAALTVLYAVLWAGGVIRHLFIGPVAPAQNLLASAFLTLAGLIVLLSTRTRGDVLRLCAVACCGLLIELCGVRSGLPFGRYAYADVLRPTLFGVPVVMAFAWMVLVAYMKQALLRLRLSRLTGALVAAVWMTGIDLVIDPLAGNDLGYWRWASRGVYYGIPASNFAGWFMSSLVIFLLFRRDPESNRGAQLTGVSILLFFTLIAFSFQLFVAAAVGCALFVLHILVFGGRLGARIARRS
ncbi:MAG: carotenoid biosynthesis protein [Pyrinomonadaceae bacterium]